MIFIKNFRIILYIYKKNKNKNKDNKRFLNNYISYCIFFLQIKVFIKNFF